MPITFALVLLTLLAQSVVAAFDSAVYHRAVRLLPAWAGLLYAAQGLGVERGDGSSDDCQDDERGRPHEREKQRRPVGGPVAGFQNRRRR